MKKHTSFLAYKTKDWMRDFSALSNPLILVFIPFIYLGNTTTFYTLLIALVINEIVGSAIKIIFPKKRPNGQIYKNTLEKIDAGSFPSLHSSRITLVYLTLFTNADNIVLKIICIAIIILVMLSRILLKKHFLIDVIAGFAIGWGIWYIQYLWR